MVKITYIGKRYRSLRTRKGYFLGWNKGDTVDVEDEELLKELKTSNNFVEPNEIGKEVGSGGLKTHVRPPKRGGRLDKSRKHVDKSKQATKEKVTSKSKGKPKKPRGLRKPKRAN
tara:strand:- start:17 stop:361 length:345 start_codon:yes stop_codon:yes gene_type:complete